jgi:hypothetical protein
MRRFNSGPRLQVFGPVYEGDARFGQGHCQLKCQLNRVIFTIPAVLRHECAETRLLLANTRGLDAGRIRALPMTPRYTLFRRGKMFYAQDTETRQQTSLRSKDRGEALTLLHAKNEAFRQPSLNLQMARTYLSASDPEIAKRPWSVVMDEMGKTKKGAALHRHESAMRDAAFDLIRAMPILETQAVHLLRVMETGCVSTNIFLRRLHNFALGMSWLSWPILPKKRWPKIMFKEKRAVTCEEHRAIVEGEHNPERRAYMNAAGTWVRRRRTWPSSRRKILIGTTGS